MFRALADPTRRALLDALFERDARSLHDLCTIAPDLSRFTVMKHLGILEDAGLITTRKVGRQKLHHLNPVPIQRLADRWIGKFAQPFTRALADLDERFNRPHEETS